jgi:hypothetical protein
VLVFPELPSWVLGRVAVAGRDFAIRDALWALPEPIEAYAPVRTRLVRRRYTHKRFEVRAPALSPYLFVHIVDPDAWLRAFRSMWRVHPVVIRGVVAVVRPTVIAQMHEMEASGAFDEPNACRIAFRAGEAVLVSSGTFESSGLVLADSRPDAKVKVVFASGMSGRFAPERVSRIENGGEGWRRE